MIRSLYKTPSLKNQIFNLIKFYTGPKCTLPKDHEIYTCSLGNGLILVGCYSLRYNYIKYNGNILGPWIFNLIVKDNYRGKGIGRMLLKDAIKRNNYEELYTCCKNPKYFHFLKSEGFKYIGYINYPGIQTRIAMFEYGKENVTK